MKKRVRLPRKLLLVAGAGVASMTLNGCLFTSGNLMAPPPCDDAGHYDCTPDAGQDGGHDAGRDAGHSEDASTGDAGSGDAGSGDAGSGDGGSGDGGDPGDAGGGDDAA